MAKSGSFENVSVEIDQNEVITLHLRQREVATLEPDASAEGISDREMTHGHVAVAFNLEDPMCACCVVERVSNRLILVVLPRRVRHSVSFWCERCVVSGCAVKQLHQQ